jgi:hypothetical protein
MQKLQRRQRIRRPGTQRSQRTRRTLLQATHSLPRTTSSSSPAKLNPNPPQNRILLASSLRPPHLLRPQSPRAGLASDQPVVARLLKISMVIVNLYFYHAFANVIDMLSNSAPLALIYSYSLLAFCTMRRIHPDLLAIIAVLCCST